MLLARLRRVHDIRLGLHKQEQESSLGYGWSLNWAQFCVIADQCASTKVLKFPACLPPGAHKAVQ